MKNYSAEIAARAVVSKRVSFGTSRHKLKQKKIEVVTSVGTARNHRNALKVCADWLLEVKGKNLKNLNENDAAEYLTFRALTVGQSAVDLTRQSINFHLLYETPIPFVASTIEYELTNRAYSQSQIDLLDLAATEKIKLSIQIAQNAGLRAMELITISPLEVLRESTRSGWNKDRFLGRSDDVPFCVAGKGGLRRQIRLSPNLADLLWCRRRSVALLYRDREVNHESFFDLTAGVNFSAQFSRLSARTLGISHGAHGLRHTFAKRRLRELLCNGLNFDDALKVLSNELGHFSIENTFAYLRD